jgi:hypothetical protein
MRGDESHFMLSFGKQVWNIKKAYSHHGIYTQEWTPRDRAMQANWNTHDLAGRIVSKLFWRLADREKLFLILQINELGTLFVKTRGRRFILCVFVRVESRTDVRECLLPRHSWWEAWSPGNVLLKLMQRHEAIPKRSELKPRANEQLE